jgi:hypothetical protein
MKTMGLASRGILKMPSRVAGLFKDSARSNPSSSTLVEID